MINVAIMSTLARMIATAMANMMAACVSASRVKTSSPWSDSAIIVGHRGAGRQPPGAFATALSSGPPAATHNKYK